MDFAKYEGLGNDFVLVSAEVASQWRVRDRAVEICDRHRGIGADGVLVFGTGPTPSMEVVNSDGSLAMMCGNGLRCVALHLLRIGAVSEPRFRVDTASGPHDCEVLPDGRVRVGMRAGSLVPAEVPVTAAGRQVDAPWRVQEHDLALTCVSMGNPHAVTFDAVGEARLVLGPLLAADARFPEGVNVGFAQVRGPAALELHVLERGAGWTEACGTGACAAVVAAVETGRVPAGEEVQVRLPGGALVIRADGEGSTVWMTGPAEHVFDGVWQR